MFVWHMMKEIVYLFSFMKTSKKTYFFAILGDGVVQAGAIVFLPFVFKDLTDFAYTKDTTLLTQAVLTMGVALVILSILSPLCTYLYMRIVRRVMNDVRLSVFDHMGKLPVRYFEQHHSGDTMARLSSDAVAMEGAYSEQIKMISIIAISLLGSLVGMYILDWRIATGLLFVSLLTLLMNLLYSKSVRATGDYLQQQMGTLTERLNDFLAGLSMVKMFNLQRIIPARYAEANEIVTSSAIKLGHKNALLEGVNFLVHFISFGGTLVVGILLVSKEIIGLGAMVGIVQQQMVVTLSFLQLGQMFAVLQGSLAGASRIKQFLEVPMEAERISMGANDSEESSPYTIELRDVCFGYDPKTNTLNHVSMHVAAGQVAAIVGTSGGGKSTVTKLLLGFYPPNSGAIYLQGKSIDAYTVAELRELIAYVPQDTYLFEGTIEENIRYGKPAATQEEIWAASKAAYAHEFIMELPEGYQTQTGERGAMLSGGQRQRIAIARALLRDAPILILDEATSALDTESEQEVQQALSVLMKGKTTIVIAHRLSTVEDADIIYVMDQGSVIEQGNHKELLSLGGCYARLYDTQYQLNP